MGDRRKDQNASRRANGGDVTTDARTSTNARLRRGKAAADPISAGLKALWADVEKEPVPDDFISLLERIDASVANGKLPGEETGT